MWKSTRQSETSVFSRTFICLFLSALSGFLRWTNNYPLKSWVHRFFPGSRSFFLLLLLWPFCEWKWHSGPTSEDEKIRYLVVLGHTETRNIAPVGRGYWLLHTGHTLHTSQCHQLAATCIKLIDKATQHDFCFVGFVPLTYATTFAAPWTFASGAECCASFFLVQVSSSMDQFKGH